MILFTVINRLSIEQTTFNTQSPDLHRHMITVDHEMCHVHGIEHTEWILHNIIKDTKHKITCKMYTMQYLNAKFLQWTWS